jgi:hypothetical protein
MDGMNVVQGSFLSVTGFIFILGFAAGWIWAALQAGVDPHSSRTKHKKDDR